MAQNNNVEKAFSQVTYSLSPSDEIILSVGKLQTDGECSSIRIIILTSDHLILPFAALALLYTSKNSS